MPLPDMVVLALLGGAWLFFLYVVVPGLAAWIVVRFINHFFDNWA